MMVLYMGKVFYKSFVGIYEELVLCGGGKVNYFSLFLNCCKYSEVLGEWVILDLGLGSN